MPAECADRRAAYLDLVTGPMLEACAPYARWVDVFCEPRIAARLHRGRGRRVLAAGRDAGLGLRVHGNQLGPGPGVRLAVELGAASVDHCTYLSDADVEALVGAAGTTVATLLPGVEFSTRSPYPDARRLLDAGVLDRAGDRLQPRHLLLVVDAVRHRPRGARDAADAGRGAVCRDRRARAVAAAQRHRPDRRGCTADLAVLDAPSYLHLAYRAGVPIARALELAAS